MFLVYSQGGWTALHMAVEAGKVDVVKLLIEFEVQVNIQSEVCYV